MSNEVQARRPAQSSAPPAAPALSPDDPRALAAKRAEEIREQRGGSMDDGTDKFYINPRDIPDGWSYEWKRQEVLGKRDPSYEVSLAYSGWEPVPRSRHSEMMPANFPGETITRDGLILMQRPQETTDERRQRDNRIARDQVRAKEENLTAAPPGTFERDNKGNRMGTVKKSFEHIPIAEK